MMDPLKKTRSSEMGTRSPRFEYQTEPGISINQSTNKQSLVVRRSEKSEAFVCDKKGQDDSESTNRTRLMDREITWGAAWSLSGFGEYCFSFKCVEAYGSMLCFSYATLQLSGKALHWGGSITVYPGGLDAIGSICNKRYKNTNPALNSMLKPHLSIKTYSLEVLLSHKTSAGTLPS